uniref:Glutathione peroxidase n=2 Tax=Clytia hemisphaerica TaxID=252671 RepID=A0A7M5UTW0_9CNID|eukprot:TCONS_00045851-protein
MNELMDKYASKGLSILAFPCNQFGHQENCTNSEILSTLKYVRPGNGYVPKFDMFAKVEVNGSNTHPVFKFLKQHLPLPHDDQVSLMGNNAYIIWNPVERSDIAWNFEKFLVGKNGLPIKRYSKKFETMNIADDIEAALKAA